MTSLHLHLPAVVHRIQRRQPIARSPCSSENKPRLHGMECPAYTTPTVHMWCIHVAESDKPHLVVFADADDARSTARAIASFTRSMKRVPHGEADLRSLFGFHFRSTPVSERRRQNKTSLHTESCDLNDVLRWTAARRLGVLAIGKIERDVEPIVAWASNDDEPDIDVIINAFHQDFLWQLT